MSMKDRKMIVVSVEGLAASALGCYGSSWNVTPAVDLLASGGCVWDRCIARECDGLETLRRWMQPTETDTPSKASNWIEDWNAISTVELITDDHRISSQSIDNDFDDTWLIEIDADEGGKQPCDEPEETHLAKLFAALFERLDAEDPSSVFWLHTQSLVRIWDAPRWLVPYDYDEHDLTEEPSEEVELLTAPGREEEKELDTSPPWIFNDVVPPIFEIAKDAHPDLVMSWMRTYGCQVRLFDHLLSLLSSLAKERGYLVVVVGTSGFSLGQNGWFGYQAGPLRSCHHRIPLLIRDFSSIEAMPIRARQVVSADFLGDKLSTLFEESSPLLDATEWATSQTEFEPAITTRRNDFTSSVTTPHWYLVREGQNHRLYYKPDDICDHNDVSRIREDVVDKLSR